MNNINLPPLTTGQVWVGDTGNPAAPTDTIGTGDVMRATAVQNSTTTYAASSGGTDAYAITLSPVPSAYVNGMSLSFKADVANTGAATLNVNSLGPIAITKQHDVPLTTGDIEANQIVQVVYNSTGPTFQMQSQGAGTASNLVGTANQIDVTAPGASQTASISSTFVAPGTVTLNADPVTNLQAATKQYVDAIAAGIDFKASALVATTATLNATYANGSSGVGATLTNAGALAAFSVDGQSPAINSRVLVKNQSAPAENGIYTLTTVGSGAVAWVLTRATDYDTTAEITPGNLVPVETGSVNAGTSWLQTATVAVIGTDAISFTQFSYGAYSVLQNGAPIYAADSVGTDAYAITLTPAPAAYVTGMEVRFKAGTANTGNATLNVNGLGAVNILKNHDQTLATNDIEAGQMVTVVYDGSVWQMTSQLGNTSIGPSTPGVVIQVVQGVLTSTATSSSATFADTGVTVTITPTSASSKILVIMNISTGANPAANAPCYLRLVRDSTNILLGDAGSTRVQVTVQGGSEVANNNFVGSMTYLDSPATTSATTYKVQFAASHGAAEVCINRSTPDTDNAFHTRSTSTITVMEVTA